MFEWLSANFKNIDRVFFAAGLVLWGAEAADFPIISKIAQLLFISLGLILGVVQLQLWLQTPTAERSRLSLIYAYGLLWMPFLAICLLWKHQPNIWSSTTWMYAVLASLPTAIVANIWALIWRSRADKAA